MGKELIEIIFQKVHKIHAIQVRVDGTQRKIFSHSSFNYSFQWSWQIPGKFSFKVAKNDPQIMASERYIRIVGFSKLKGEIVLHFNGSNLTSLKRLTGLGK